MSSTTRAAAWTRLAALYFAFAVAIGVAMGASGNHTLAPLHAHMNLLGWVSTSLFALIARAYPATAEGRVADAHFWLYNLGLPVMLAAMAAKLQGAKAIGPVLGIASIVVGVSVLLFAWLVVGRLSFSMGERKTARLVEPERSAC